ncbi:hypothetical protein BH20VER1_BH20VER1_11720 [soil metagenome]
MRRNRRLVLWIVATVLLLGVLGAIAVRVGFGWYLGSEAFRKRMNAEVSRALEADGEFLPLQITGSSVYSVGFEARGRAGAFFTTLRAQQVRAELDWRGVFRRVWRIEELTAQRLEVEFATREVQPEAPRRAEPVVRRVARSKRSSFKLDLREARVADSRWRWGSDAATAGSITGSALRIAPDGEAWLIHGTGGKLAQSGWPELAIEDAQLRYTRDTLFITGSNLRHHEARLAVSGEVRFDEAADLQVQLTDVPLEPLLPVDWRVRLHGNVSGLTRIHAPLAEVALMRTEGSLRLTNGHVEALPVLNEIALFMRTERFRRVVLTKASLDFVRDQQVLTATNVVLESEGLLRIEGQFTVAQEVIDGTFAVGVTAASLQWLPGAQARVFTVARDGYLWTSMRVAGPVSRPSEDLSPRLVQAVAGELLETPESMAREAVKLLRGLIPR